MAIDNNKKLVTFAMSHDTFFAIKQLSKLDVILFPIKKDHGIDNFHIIIHKTWLLNINYPTTIDLQPVDKYFSVLYDRSYYIIIEE